MGTKLPDYGECEYCGYPACGCDTTKLRSQLAARDRELAKACELIQWLTDPSSVEENTLAIQLAPAFLARHQPRKETK